VKTDRKEERRKREMKEQERRVETQTSYLLFCGFIPFDGVAIGRKKYIEKCEPQSEKTIFGYN